MLINIECCQLKVLEFNIHYKLKKKCTGMCFNKQTDSKKREQIIMICKKCTQQQ